MNPMYDCSGHLDRFGGVAEPPYDDYFETNEQQYERKQREMRIKQLQAKRGSLYAEIDIIDEELEELYAW